MFITISMPTAIWGLTNASRMYKMVKKDLGDTTWTKIKGSFRQNIR